MTLPHFLAVLRRRLLSVLAIMLIGAGLGVAFAMLVVPTYRSAASVFVSVSGGTSATDLSQGNSFSEARVASYVELATTPRILQRAAHQIGLDASVDELEEIVSARSTADTVIVLISAENEDPQVAAALANAVTDQLIDVVEGVERTDDGSSAVHLSVVQPATASREPVSPRLVVDIVVGLLGGLALGIAQAVLRDVLDTRVRSLETLRRISPASILAEFHVDDAVAKHPVIDTSDRYSMRAESFRQLRTHLTFTNLDGGSQSIVVTSSVPGEGKSSTSVNLAWILAQNGSRVVLVDADLRRPSVGTYLGLESRVGLSTVLSQQVELADAIQVVGGERPLHVLTAGRVPPNPSELLGSPQMRELIRDLELDYDYVIVDAPPLLPVTDPTVLATVCSGVVLVASADGQITQSDFVRASSTLTNVDARVLGVVANKVRGKVHTKSYEGYGPAAPLSESPRRASRARARAGA